MHAQLLAHAICGQRLVVGNDADRAGIGPLADPPDVQVCDPGLSGIRSGFNGLADFLNDRMVHFTVEQHLAGLGDEILRPNSHQHGAHDPHGRVQPRPSIEQAAGQRDHRENRRRRIGNDVQVGGLQVQILMVAVMPVAVVRVLAVVVMVLVRAGQNDRADDIDHQADGGDDQRFLVVDGLGREDPLDRRNHHGRGDPQQEDGTREAGEDLDLPGAEGEPRVAGVAPGGGVGKGAQADGHGVRTHVPAVGQQRHGVEPPAGERFPRPSWRR